MHSKPIATITTRVVALLRLRCIFAMHSKPIATGTDLAESSLQLRVASSRCTLNPLRHGRGEFGAEVQSVASSRCTLNPLRHQLRPLCVSIWCPLHLRDAL